MRSPTDLSTSPARRPPAAPASAPSPAILATTLPTILATTLPTILAAILAAILAVGLTLTASGCPQAASGDEGPSASGPSSPAPERPRAVRVAPVRVGPMRQVVRYVGTVRPHREVNILAQLPGRLTDLPVAEGASCAKGDVLVRIDSPELAARRARVRAELQRARTERGWACGRLATDERLHEAGALPKAQLDQTRRACDGAKAAVRAAQAQLREVGAQLDKVEERAPFAGHVLRWVADPGQNIMPGRPILVLAGDAPELLVRVGEADLRAGVRVGTRTLLTLTPGAPPVSTEVSWVAPAASGPTHAFDVVVALEGAPLETAPEALRLGMSVDVSFVLAETPHAVAVPERAIRRPRADEAGVPPAIFLVRGGHAGSTRATGGTKDSGVAPRAHRQPVTLGLRADGWVAITPGPPADARVVLTGVETLTEGALLFPVLDRDAAAAARAASPPPLAPPAASPPAVAPAPAPGGGPQ